MGLFTPLYMKRGLTAGQMEKAVAKIAAMTDQARLRQIAREAPEAQVRSAAVGKLNDQAQIEAIAGGDESPEVREAAIRKLDDNTALARIARSDVSTQVRQAAVRNLKGSALLAELSRDGADEEVRVIAVSRLTDLFLLAEIASGANSDRVQSKAIAVIMDELVRCPDRERDKRLDAVADPAVLERVLEQVPGTDANYKCRAAIIGRLTDQATLTRIARSDPEWSARSAAVRRLTDPATIAEIATKDPVDNVRQSAMWNKNLLSDPEFLARATFDTALGEEVRCLIVRDGLSDPRVLSRVAEESKSPKIRCKAIYNPHFDDPALLTGLAREDRSADVRRAAVSSANLEAPALMAQIALEDSDMGVRCAAIPRVQDVKVLEQIANDRTQKDRSARFLAALRLSRLDGSRALEPLVELIRENHYSLTENDYFEYKPKLREAFDFLKAAFRNGVEPDAERAIKAMNGKRYGYSGNSGCLHADYQVHFDLAR